MLWITVVILELIHVEQTQVWHLLDKALARDNSFPAQVSNDNWADRRILRRTKEISALSTVDGRIGAYHGGDG